MHLTDEDRKYVVTLIHSYCAPERTALTPTAYGLPRDHLYFVSYLAWWTKNDLSQLFSSF